MSAVVPVYLVGYVCLVLILPAGTAELSTGWRQGDGKNAVDQQDGPQKSAASQKIHLPQFLSLGIKYHFTKSWNEKLHPNQDGSFCSNKETAVIRECGISRLYDAIDGGLQYHKQLMTRDIDFNKALNNLCRTYDKFKQCLAENRITSCFEDERTVVDILYSYTCGAGRQDLIALNTGQCLSTMTISTVMKTIKARPACKNVFSDLSSTMLVMFSQYHDHLMNTSLEVDAMRENLAVLCRTWYLEETCVLPAYGKICGDSAKSFYNGLLNYMKATLAADYRRYGSEMSQLALCRRKLGKKLNNQLRKPQTMSSFHAYIIKQYRSMTATEEYFRMKFGACDLMTSYSRLVMCFWQAVYDVSDGIVNIISSFTNNYEAVTRLLEDFSHCYDDFVSDCPTENKISFANLIQSILNITGNTESTANCMDAIRLLHISGEKCGLTLSEIIEYYLFQSSKIYDNEIFRCSDDFSRLNVDFSCLKQNVEGMATDIKQQSAEPVCYHSVVTEVKAFINNLEKVTEEFMTLIKGVKERECNSP